MSRPNRCSANRARMRHVVEVLLEKETIETDEFIRLMEEPVPEPAGKVTDHEEDATVVADDTAVPAGAAGASRQD